MKIKLIHQWRDWLLESVDIGLYSFVNKNNKTDVVTIVAKNDIDAENKCQSIIKAAKKVKY